MKNFILLVVAMTIIAMSGVAIAADTTTITVSAAVVGTCKITSGAVTLPFGNLDPSTFTDTTLNGAFDFWCTRNAAYTITLDGSQRANGTGVAMNMASGPDNLPFTLTPRSNPTGTGNGPTNPITYRVDATLLQASVQAANAGNYSKIIAVSITP